MEIRTESVFESLNRPLALVESPERRAQMQAYVEAARVHLEQSIHQLLSGVVEEVNERVSDHYEVRLQYRAQGLSLVVQPRATPEETAPDLQFADGEIEKITLRLPAELKDRAAEAAAQAGLSINSWLVRAVGRAVRGAAGAGEVEEDARFGPLRRQKTIIIRQDDDDDSDEEYRPQRRGRGGRLSGWVGGGE